MREKEKIIELDGKRYKLTKLNADAGSYVAFKLAGVVIPMLSAFLGDNGNKKAKEDKEGDFRLLGAAISAMPREQFSELQKMLLGTVLKLDEDNIPMPLLKSDGSYVDEDLAMDAMAVIRLTVQAAVFNVGGFFGGKGLDRIMG